MNKKEFLQLYKEFRYPVLGSLIWTCGKLYLTGTKENVFISFITNFTAALFLLSWFTGNYNRVRKQTRVEDNFEKLLLRTEDVIKNQTESLNETISNLTGGTSFCYFIIVGINNDTNIGCYVLSVNGKYPLYDVSVRIVDSNKEIKNSFEDTGKNLVIGNCHPARSTIYNTPIQLNKEKGLKWNCFFTARNGVFIQSLRMEYHEGKWRSATQVKRGKEVIFEKIDPEFPITEKDLIFTKLTTN